VKDLLTKAYLARVKALLQANLNAANLMKAMNTFAVPILLYSFGIIGWTRQELRGLDTATRKLLCSFGCHHRILLSKWDTQRFNSIFPDQAVQDIGKEQAKKRFIEVRQATLLAKPLHGQQLRRNDANCDPDKSRAWMSSPSLTPHVEGTVFAVQDQVILTNNYKVHVLMFIGISANTSVFAILHIHFTIIL